MANYIAIVPEEANTEIRPLPLEESHLPHERHSIARTGASGQ